MGRILVLVVVVVHGSPMTMAVVVVVVADAPGRCSVMRVGVIGGAGRLLGRLLLGRLDRARGQELAHVLWVVGLLVGLQYGRPREGLAAQAAPKGPLARVHPAVVLHVVPELEGLAAELALEGPVTGVGRQVAYQRAHVREALAAELAQHHPGAGLARAPAAAAARGRVHGRGGGELEVHGLDHEARDPGCGGRGGRETGPGSVVAGLGCGRGREVQVTSGHRCRRGWLQAQLLGLELQVGRLLAVLEGLEAVRQDVARQLALVEERGAAVHAR